MTRVYLIIQFIIKATNALLPIIIALIPIWFNYILSKKMKNLEKKIEEGYQKNEELRKSILLRSEEKEKMLYQYKVDACEKLWKGVVSLIPFRKLADYLAYIKEDEYEKLKEKENVKKFIEIIGELNGIDIEKLKENNEKKVSKLDFEQIYLSEKLWGLYLEYCSITSLVLLTFLYFKDGKEDLRKLYDYNSMLDLIKKSMPQKYGNLESISTVLLPNIMSSYEEEIFKEIKNILNGVEESKESIEKSRDLIKKIEGIEENKEIKEIKSKNSEMEAFLRNPK
ncbi:hypothetical protein [Fusobacterium ulcerans]|uniref:hypothetical protein n=1 Tax=Fusobacterium ulcerans TaxID=861 RepID=UPI0030B1BE7F